MGEEIKTMEFYDSLAVLKAYLHSYIDIAGKMEAIVDKYNTVSIHSTWARPSKETNYAIDIVIYDRYHKDGGTRPNNNLIYDTFNRALYQQLVEDEEMFREIPEVSTAYDYVVKTNCCYLLYDINVFVYPFNEEEAIIRCRF